MRLGVDTGMRLRLFVHGRLQRAINRAGIKGRSRGAASALSVGLSMALRVAIGVGCARYRRRQQQRLRLRGLPTHKAANEGEAKHKGRRSA